MLIIPLVTSICPYVVTESPVFQLVSIAACAIVAQFQEESLPLLSLCPDQVVADSNNVSSSFFLLHAEQT